MTDQNWYGLVLNDYRVVLPLPVKRKFLGLLQVSRAPFTQQSGPFGAIQPVELTQLLSALPRRVLRLDLPLRESVDTNHIPGGFNVFRRTNLLLNLSSPLEEIRAGYGKTLRKKLRRYEKGGLTEVTTAEVISIYQTSAGKKAGLNEHHYRLIKQLIDACRQHIKGHLLGYQNESGELLAAGFFPVHNGRIINLFGSSTLAGYRKDGMARLLDAVIEKYRGPDTILDFEGSDLPGVRDFFKSFGAQNSPYPRIQR